MISLYFCKTEEREKFIRKALEKEVGKELSISRTAAGKPYCTGGEVQFSVSHSQMLGRGIWELVRRLEFSDGRIFLDGVLQSQKITFVFLHGAVTAVCSDENQIAIKTLQ